jgi:hypothetical protein
MKDLRNLIAILTETKELLARDENDFSWSSWTDREQAVSEIDSILSELEKDVIPDIAVLFAPTGPIQEVSLSSGWGPEFLKLARRFDSEYAIVKDRS